MKKQFYTKISGQFNWFLLCFALISINANSQSWMIQNVGYPTQGTYPLQISIVNQNTVWTVASKGYWQYAINEFSRTTDGGNTWVTGTIPIPSGQMIYSIAAIDELKAFASAIDLGYAGGYFCKTTDGGLTWSEVDSANVFSSPNSMIEGVHFLNAANGIAIGDPVGGKFEIYYTSDTGNTWLAVPQANIPNALLNEFTDGTAMDFKGSHIWFATSKGRIFKSGDYGMNWDVSNTGTAGYADVSFLSDTLTGIAMINTLSNIIYKRTVNGGMTWTAFTPPANMFWYINSIPGTNIFLSTGNPDDPFGISGSSYSTDAGVTWVTIDSGNAAANGYGYYYPAFSDIQTGWIGSTILNSTTGGIYKWNPGSLTGIYDVTVTGNQLIVYPNPASENIMVQNAPVNSTFELYDLTGRIIKQVKSTTSLNGTYQLDLKNTAPGLYLLKASNEKQIYQAKVVIR